jgi:hypothetical protein
MNQSTLQSPDNNRASQWRSPEHSVLQNQSQYQYQSNAFGRTSGNFQARDSYGAQAQQQSLRFSGSQSQLQARASYQAVAQQESVKVSRVSVEREKVVYRSNAEEIKDRIIVTYKDELKI